MADDIDKLAQSTALELAFYEQFKDEDSLNGCKARFLEAHKAMRNWIVGEFNRDTNAQMQMEGLAYGVALAMAQLTRSYRSTIAKVPGGPKIPPHEIEKAMLHLVGRAYYNACQYEGEGAVSVSHKAAHRFHLRRN